MRNLKLKVIEYYRGINGLGGFLYLGGGDDDDDDGGGGARVACNSETTPSYQLRKRRHR